MRKNKAVVGCLVFCLLAGSFGACSAEQKPVGDPQTEALGTDKIPEQQETAETVESEDDSVRPENTDTEGVTEGESESEDAAMDAEVYREYLNLSTITQFYGDLAVFAIKTYDGWGKAVYYGGCMDIEGNVVIPPNYTRLDLTDEPYMFAYDYMRDGTTKYHRANILDRRGNVVFAEYADQISDIGEVKNGCFYVEREEVTLSGNEYTKTYYSIHDLSEVSADQYHDAKTAHESAWEEVSSMEAYQGAYVRGVNIPAEGHSEGNHATVILQSPDGVYFFGMFDVQGNVVMEPQRNIAFEKEISIFCQELCPAKDEATGLWGYINPQGNWVLQPQYGAASRFDAEGYAVVDHQTIINTRGEVILAPTAWQGNAAVALSGKYHRNERYMRFQEDGSVEISNGYVYVNAQYRIVGGTLIISGVGKNNAQIPVQDGSHSFRIHETGIVVDGDVWTKSS